jgi:general secretion pathway protein D
VAAVAAPTATGQGGRVRASLSEGQQPSGVTSVRVFVLRYASAADLVPVLQQILNRPGGPLAQVVAHPETNSLVILGSGDDLKQAEGLIQALDTGRAEQKSTRVYRLSYAAAAEVAQVLRELLSDSGKLPANTRIAVDGATNSLVVTGGDPVHQQVRPLVEELDVRGPALGTRVYSLRYAQASKLADLIRELYLSPEGGSSSTRPAGPHVAADQRTNSVVLYGDSELQERVLGLLKSLDVPAPEK